MIPVTGGLSLQQADLDNTDQQSAIRSRLFLRAYQHLIRIIESAGETEEQSIYNNGSLNTPSGEKFATSMVDSSNLAINVISNLLVANLDVGLKHCLTLGYHRDSRVRTAFMQILSHTLKNGSRFGNSATKRQSGSNRPYLDAVLSSNSALAVALVDVCPNSETDELFQVLFRSFEAKGSLLSFMRILIEREVSLTSECHPSEGTLKIV